MPISIAISYSTSSTVASAVSASQYQYNKSNRKYLKYEQEMKKKLLYIEIRGLFTVDLLCVLCGCISQTANRTL